MIDTEKIRLYAGISENLSLVGVIHFVVRLFITMNLMSTKNAQSADNQQATPLLWESPQRLYAEYPKKKRITVEESILLGILFTDGCVSRKNKSSWRLYLGNTSFEIIQTFRECIVKLFDLPSTQVRISQKISNGKPYYVAIVDNAYIGNVLTLHYGTFRTLAFMDDTGAKIYPATTLPKILYTNSKMLAYFLQAAFSCDGGVNLYKGKSKQGYTFLIRNVYIACSHPQLQLEYQRLLSVLDITSKLMIKDKRILIQGRSEIVKFQEKIGFLSGVKITQHSAFWQGWEKNQVLQLLVSSYGRPKDILNLSQFLG